MKNSIFTRWRYGKQYGYHTFFESQDAKPEGKTGVILADIGMPEDYDPAFYINYMHHVFQYSIPAFLHPLILANRGIALIDPENPLARKPFTPTRLVDMYGSFTNKQGKPYVECPVTWRPPGIKKNEADLCYFLYKEDGKGGAPDICQKTAAKVVGWYYGHLLGEKKVSWEHQCRLVYNETDEQLGLFYPGVAVRHAGYAIPESIEKAVNELLAEDCKTIVYQSFCNPVYSDFEEYAYALPLVYKYVNGRAKVICADQPGNQPALRKAFVTLLADQLNALPELSSVLVILSKHGHPFKKETMDRRGDLYRLPLEREIRNLMESRKGKWEVMWSDDEYGDEYWDPQNKKPETRDAYLKAINELYDFAIELPTDFIAENTDLMILHALRKFSVFPDYNPNETLYYPDWEKPFVRTFHSGKTTGIYAGCPVGPYRRFVVEAIVNSVGEILNRREL
jgi:protoheme ferro-lyase